MKYVGIALLSIVIACSNGVVPKTNGSNPTSCAPSESISDVSPYGQVVVGWAPPNFCPDDMVLVSGNYCPVVEQTCLKWDEKVINVNGKVRCLEFAPTKCLSKQKKAMSFCIDKFEYPNKLGAIPEVMVTWNEMAVKCAAEGKRLCKDVEWEFACEGEDALPYPYGLNRDPGTCNIDNAWRAFDGGKLSNPATRQAEVDRLSQRVPSGSKPGCVSPFGVYDMTGNVDESVINSSGSPYKSGEKGGHWAMGARNRCRPMTTVHNESFAFYEIGGRCCKEAN
jgi:hypothetical protein